MPLTISQLAWTGRITRESQADITAALSARPLTTVQEGILADDIDVWESIENSYIKYKGEGVDFDNERKRAGIFYRVRNMLGFPFIAYEYDALMLELFELEVGQNFG
jgi:hypothetical protein